MPVVDLDAVLGNPKNRIAKAAVELEGCWNPIPPGIVLEHDGSVFRDRRVLEREHYGEIPSGPLVPAGISRFIKKYFPTQIDDTCGLHVHMSFDTLRYYGMLMDNVAYQDTMITYLTKWAQNQKFPDLHPIWNRLEGKSIFAQKVFWPEAQLKNKRKDRDQHKEGHRYTIVHYCSWLNTVEIRVLPMFVTPELCISAVKRVLDVTNAYLWKQAKTANIREFVNNNKTKIAINFNNMEVQEELISLEIPLTNKERQAAKDYL